MRLQTNCLPNSNFCQFSIQIFCPFFAKFFLDFCQLVAQFFSNCLPIFCQFFARINFSYSMVFFFRPWMPYYQTFGQKNWKWQSGEPNQSTEGTIYELTLSPRWPNWPDDQRLPAFSTDKIKRFYSTYIIAFFPYSFPADSVFLPLQSTLAVIFQIIFIAYSPCLKFSSTKYFIL